MQASEQPDREPATGEPATGALQSPPETNERVVCIGDVHGNLAELEALWASLRDYLGGEAALRQTAVVFLGDYCDRGPNTRGVLDWLVRLKSERSGDDVAPAHFLMGNHDFGFAAFLGCLPIGGPPPTADWLESTKDPRFTEGFWPHPVESGMHYQGRRWGALRTYNAGATFKSYGVQPDFRMPPRMREELVAAVPASHRDFLASLQWVHDRPLAWLPGRLIAVHAGLDSDRPAAPQLERLHARDLTSATLHERGDPSRFAALSGRQGVLPMPDELAGKALLVSGHHGFVDLAHGHPDRVIVDRSGGVPGRPLEAVVLPERATVSSMSSVSSHCVV